MTRASAGDYRVGDGGRDDRFARGLGPGVFVDRCGPVLFDIVALRAVKHVVGREVDEPRPAGGRSNRRPTP